MSERDPDASPEDDKAKPSKAGEFTRMFEAAPAPTEAPQGEFTRMFEAAPAASSAAQQEPQPFKQPVARSRPLAESRPANSRSGDFGAMFKSEEGRRSGSSQTNWLDFRPPESSGSLKDVNWDLPQQDQRATGVSAARASSLPQPSLEQGPSEFTKLIEVKPSSPKEEVKPISPKEIDVAAASPETRQPPAPIKPAPAPQSITSLPTTNLPIIIAFNVMLLTAITLILYFVLKR